VRACRPTHLRANTKAQERSKHHTGQPSVMLAAYGAAWIIELTLTWGKMPQETAGRWLGEQVRDGAREVKSYPIDCSTAHGPRVMPLNLLFVTLAVSVVVTLPNPTVSVKDHIKGQKIFFDQTPKPSRASIPHVVHVPVRGGAHVNVGVAEHLPNFLRNRTRAVACVPRRFHDIYGRIPQVCEEERCPS
jgi:hypothetical protein